MKLSPQSPFDPQALPLMTDLYELAMVQAYWHSGMQAQARFSLFFRELPQQRNFMLACGQQQVCRLITELAFDQSHIERLRQLDMFQPEFLDWLSDFRFSGRIRTVPEGTPVFPQEPLLEVTAPVAEAQLLETLVMNFVHLETVLASKAARVVMAAGEKPVVDFGMRRMHGLDAAYRGTRAYKVAGLAGTSHILAGQDFDLPVRGTMAHSFIQAHGDELAAFKAYARLYPGTTLLVDTYDTLRALDRMIQWLLDDPQAQISAIRLDSGDMEQQSRQCRERLDEAGFSHIKILASGGLDEHKIRHMVERGAPIDGFGVGTAIGAASDAPSLELAYKLTEYDGQPRLKNSPGKASWPGGKQVWRQRDGQGQFRQDQLTHEEESGEGEPLLIITVDKGQLLESVIASPDESRDHARRSIEALPGSVRSLTQPARYPVIISDRLEALRQSTLEKLG
ncbi:MAG: nicotinate phosphoribosyltransferase [Oleiphilaceae bacterium]|nr:nicotinate phosphoribosyltransferase [Oleiphilaceae bacterium]